MESHVLRSWTQASESQVLVFFSGGPQKQPPWVSQKHGETYRRVQVQTLNGLAAWWGPAPFQIPWLPNMWTGWSLACASEYPLEAGICGLGSIGLLFRAAVVCGIGPCTGCDCACICPDVGVKTVIFSMMKVSWLVVEKQSPTIACNNSLHLDFKSNFLALITISQQCLNFSRKKKKPMY